jgi:hypothetical protein
MKRTDRTSTNVRPTMPTIRHSHGQIIWTDFYAREQREPHLFIVRAGADLLYHFFVPPHEAQGAILAGIAAGTPVVIRRGPFHDGYHSIEDAYELFFAALGLDQSLSWVLPASSTSGVTPCCAEIGHDTTMRVYIGVEGVHTQVLERPACYVGRGLCLPWYFPADITQPCRSCNAPQVVH